MVDVGEPGDEPWPGPETRSTREPVSIGELQAACELVARGYADLAVTLVPAGDIHVTAARTYELGRRLTEYGELWERYWEDSIAPYL